MNGDDMLLGMVQAGSFQPLAPAVGMGTRLTGISMVAAQPPESAELDLTKYEGSAIMASGHLSGGWLYSAHIIDHAGPILTKVVKQVFGQEEAAGLLAAE